MFEFFCYSHKCQEDEVHHQGVDDRRDGYYFIIEDKRTARDGNGLRGILHADLDDQRAAFFACKTEEPSEQCAATGSSQNEDGHREAERSKLRGDSLSVLHEKNRYQQQQSRHRDTLKDTMDLLSRLFPEDIDNEPDGYRHDHENNILDNQFTDRQVDCHRFSDARRDP